jgi:hypothetical protein
MKEKGIQSYENRLDEGEVYVYLMHKRSIFILDKI